MSRDWDFLVIDRTSMVAQWVGRILMDDIQAKLREKTALRDALDQIDPKAPVLHYTLQISVLNELLVETQIKYGLGNEQVGK